jgi:squalene-hopene/tetraprenyl-beta-curcumene cyclase
MKAGNDECLVQDDAGRKGDRHLLCDDQRCASVPAAGPFRQKVPVPFSPANVHQAIARTRQWLLDRQAVDGSWCAELEGDTILESETVLLLAHLGREQEPLARKAAAYLIEKQLPAGGWAMYPGGDMDPSGSVKAYFALKLLGHDPNSAYMQRARQAILSHGGADAVNSYTRFFLAMLGQISYKQCPAVPPEAVLLPKWFPVNLYGISAWSRTILVPLSIVSALQPIRRIEPDRGIRELFLRSPEDWPRLRCPGLPGGTGPVSWDRFFRGADGLLKWCQRHRLLPFRRRALAAAESWMLARFAKSDGLGAIFPPIVFSLAALKSRGYPDDSAAVRECYKQLTDLVIEDPQSGAARLQPCKSPVWDTAIAARALAAAGVAADHPAMSRAIDWLLDKQTTAKGDWAQTVPVEPGGWYFEYANGFYPDVDDTAMVLMALQAQFAGREAGGAGCVSRLCPGRNREFLVTPPHPGPLPEGEGDSDSRAPRSAPPTPNPVPVLKRTMAAIDRGLRWMLAMQNSDGGWGAFDRNNNRRFLCYVPFADHNAMIDPSTPDLCGRVLEALGRLGRRVGDPVVDRAVAYIRSAQESDGCWFGRWGVNYIYGTWQVLTGLTGVGVPADDPAVVAGAKWLLGYQQPCGGWGESPASYQRPERCGDAPATASQTAWAVLGLMAAGHHGHPAVARGIDFLITTQQPDGSWIETQFTGTGFPRVFYLRYHYYPVYFPLMALACWAAGDDEH